MVYIFGRVCGTCLREIELMAYIFGQVCGTYYILQRLSLWHTYLVEFVAHWVYGIHLWSSLWHIYLKEIGFMAYMFGWVCSTYLLRFSLWHKSLVELGAHISSRRDWVCGIHIWLSLWHISSRRDWVCGTVHILDLGAFVVVVMDNRCHIPHLLPPTPTLFVVVNAIFLVQLIFGNALFC